MEKRIIYNNHPQNSILINLCCMRADAKPCIWRMFFGWRSTKSTPRGDACTFIFSKSEWLEIFAYQACILEIFKNYKNEV